MTQPTFTTFGTPTASPAPLYVDGAPLDALLEALDHAVLAGHRHSSGDRFWSTPPRAIGDLVRDVIEIDFNTVRRMNWLTFDLAHFPQRTEVQFLSPKTGGWSPVLNEAGRPVVVTFTDSNPSRLLPVVDATNHVHPQHQGDSHWVTQEIKARPFFTNRIRFVLTRPFGTAPINIAGQQVPFSLGVRAFDAAYKVQALADVPQTVPDLYAANKESPFLAATDLLGSSIEYALRENPASGLLHDGIWRCEPQPSPFAVVNLYVDVRDIYGNARVIDRLFMDPLYSGAHVTLYATEQEPTGEFVASDTPLAYPASYIEGVPPERRTNGFVFGTQASRIVLDNQAVQFRANKPWWLGISLTVNATGAHRVFTCAAFHLDYDGTQFTLTSGGVTVAVSPGATNGGLYGLVASYDGSALSLKVSRPDSTTTVALATAPTSINTPLNRLVVGTEEGGSQAPEFTLHTLVLKQAVLDTNEDAAFFEAPSSFALKPEYARDDDGRTNNAVVRYDKALTQPLTSPERPANITGFLGGPGDRYESLTWTPINRDFVLRRGNYDFDPTRARYIKCEFTNLTVQPFEVFTPITRKMKVFPADVLARFEADQAVRQTSVRLGGGAMTQNVLLGQSIKPITVDPAKGYTPTSAKYVSDPNAAQRLSTLSYLYRFTAWQTGATAPRFTHQQVHHYETLEVLHEQKIAFFVGLKGIRAYRKSYTANDDAGMYLDLFHDDWHISQSTWTLDGYGLAAPGLLGDRTEHQATSKAFKSVRRVRGIQFATTQSPPIELLPDPDFNDTELTDWTLAGDAFNPGDAGSNKPQVSNDYNTDIGTTVKVTRDTTSNPRTWDQVNAEFHTYSGLEGKHYVDVESQVVGIGFGGLRSKSFVVPSLAGRLYAAARVVSPTPLDQPLVVQIVASDGTVLAEEERLIAPNEVNEWYAAYTIGEGGAATPNTYDDVSAAHPTWAQAEGRTWDQLGFDTERLNLPVTARLIQRGAAHNSWYTDNLALFDDSIVWEFSNDGGKRFFPVYDIRNNPRGVFIFPDGPETAFVPGDSSGAPVGDTGGAPAPDGPRTYQQIEDLDPSPFLPTYGDLSVQTYAELGNVSASESEGGSGPVQAGTNPAYNPPHPDPTVGYDLVWRVTGYRAGLHVNSLAIRPWYDDLVSHQPAPEMPQISGPNIAPYDHYPRIEDDPHWKLWHKPIPEEWFFFQRQWLLLRTEVATTVTSVGVPTGYLNDTLLLSAGAPVIDNRPAELLSDGLVYDPPPGSLLGDAFIIPGSTP
jgi:hypothetical protein